MNTNFSTKEMSIKYFRELFNSSIQNCENEIHRNFQHPITNFLGDDESNNFDPIAVNSRFIRLNDTRIDNVKIIEIKKHAIMVKINWTLVSKLFLTENNQSHPREEHYYTPLTAFLNIKFPNGIYSEISLNKNIAYPFKNPIYSFPSYKIEFYNSLAQVSRSFTYKMGVPILKNF